MTNEFSHRRNKSQFQKGMTLEEYLRNMEVTQQTIPTADSNFKHSREEDECLYKTSHQFYDKPIRQNGGCIKEIQEENFEESLDQYKDCINIISDHLQPLNKRPAPHLELGVDKPKNYRIRGGMSNSPYKQQNFQIKRNTFSPYKTFIVKKGPIVQAQKNNEQKHLKDVRENNKIVTIRSIYGKGKETENRKSHKNIKVDPEQNYILSFNQNIVQLTQKPFQRNDEDNIRGYYGQPQKFDIRIQTMKERLQMKRKNKNKI